jgi:hypothetical protein
VTAPLKLFIAPDNVIDVRLSRLAAIAEADAFSECEVLRVIAADIAAFELLIDLFVERATDPAIAVNDAVKIVRYVRTVATLPVQPAIVPATILDVYFETVAAYDDIAPVTRFPVIFTSAAACAAFDPAIVFCVLLTAVPENSDIDANSDSV